MKMDAKLSRRQFLKGAAIAGAGMALPLKFGVRDSYAYYQSHGSREMADSRCAASAPAGSPLRRPMRLRRPSRG